MASFKMQPYDVIRDAEALKCLIQEFDKEFHKELHLCSKAVSRSTYFQFGNPRCGDKLVECAFSLDALRKELTMARETELEFQYYWTAQERRLEDERERLNSLYRLPDISCYAGNNRFEVLEDADTIEYTVCPSEEEDISSPSPMFSRSRPKQSFIYYDDKNNWQFKKDYWKKSFVRKPDQISRLNLVLRMFRFNRIKRIPFLNYFSDNKLDMKVLYTKSYKYNDIVCIFRYVSHHICDRLNAIENMRETQPILQTYDELYERMPEDIKEFIYPEEYIPMCNLKKTLIIRSQMAGDDPGPHGDCDELNVEKASNVILTTHAEESVAQPIDIDVGIWEKLCSSQVVQQYAQLMDRWQKYKTFSWKTSQGVSDSVIRIGIFRDLVSAFKDMPAFILLKTYAYFRSDIEIKIVLNSNKFNCGSLLGYMYYGNAMDKYFKDRQNVWCASQLSHCILDAANSTSATITIPYRHYKPLLATSSRPDDEHILDIAIFELLVLNKLNVPSVSDGFVNGTVFVRFITPSFHGMKPRIENQMMGVASIIKNTAALVNQVFPDDQRDNPSDPSPSTPMVPQSTHSWSLGDMISEPINVLRLQATGNTPHPPGTLPKEPEMDIAYVKQIYGLFKQIEWKTSHIEGEVLARIPFSPELATYPTVVCNNPERYQCNVMPPLSVLAQLFSYWRGSIEYKLDFISTFAHTGSLIIGYVPRLTVRTVTLSQLTNCDHILVNLQDEKQVIYTCNFLSDKPWWPRRSFKRFSTENYPPGYIYIMVNNQLSASQSVTQTVNINLYMRGGKDFEFHVPCNPHVGLSFNTTVVKSKVPGMTYLVSYGPPRTTLYIGTWYTVNDKFVFRYGSVSDHVTQFNAKDLKENTVYKLSNTSDYPYYINTNKTKHFCPYVVLFRAYSLSYVYGAPFGQYQNALRFANSLDKDFYAIRYLTDEEKKDPANQGKTLYDVTAYMSGDGVDGPYYSNNTRLYWNVSESVTDFEVIEAQAGDERLSDCGAQVILHKTIATTQSGIITFGERVDNFKQLLRRYQPYSYTELKGKGAASYSVADIGIPIMPQGLDFSVKIDNKENLYVNRSRDGPLPIIASGYRFFRGSVRIRIIVGSEKTGVLWVQHRPDVPLLSTQPFIPDPTEITSYFNPGYAYHVQDTSINNIMELEIPFYLPGQFGMLQRPNLNVKEDAAHYSLGTLLIGFDIPLKGSIKDIPFAIQTFYSMGDDMSFSVFQGFPPMIDLSLFQPEAQGPGIMDKAKNYLTGKATDAVVEGIAAELSTMNEIASEEDKPSMLGQIKELISKFVPDLDQIKQVSILNLLSQIVHCIINPTIGTLAWAMASLFVSLGFVCYSTIERLINTIKNFLKKYTAKSELASKLDKARVVAQGDTDCPEAAFISTVVTGVLKLAGGVNKPFPKDMPNFASYLYDGIPKFTLTANSLFTFFKNNLVMIKNIWLWVVGKFNKDYILYTELYAAPSDVKAFIKEIQWSLDARNSDAIRANVGACSNVYKLAAIAQSYMAKRSVSKIEKPMPMFDMYCRKIVDLRDTLTREMKSPPVRFEPFVVAIVGDSNIGKSHFAQRLAQEMLKSIDYKANSELVYVRNPGNQYWNGLKNQPVVLYDDWLNISDPNYALITVGELYQLKSKAVFNPAMAAIEDKQIRYNPLIVILLMNEAFPKIPGVTCEEALFRRRDVLFKASKKVEYKGIHPRDLPSEVKHSYGHLQFQQYASPAGLTADDRKPVDEVLTYTQFLPRIVEKFNTYFQEECVQYSKTITELSAFVPALDTSADDYLKGYEARVNEHNALHSVRDTKEFNEIVDLLKASSLTPFTDDITKLVQKQIKEGKSKQLVEEQQKRIHMERTKQLYKEFQDAKLAVASNTDPDQHVKLYETMNAVRILYERHTKMMLPDTTPSVTTMLSPLPTEIQAVIESQAPGDTIINNNIDKCHCSSHEQRKISITNWFRRSTDGIDSEIDSLTEARVHRMYHMMLCDYNMFSYKNYPCYCYMMFRYIDNLVIRSGFPEFKIQLSDNIVTSVYRNFRFCKPLHKDCCLIHPEVWEKNRQYWYKYIDNIGTHHYPEGLKRYLGQHMAEIMAGTSDEIITVDTEEIDKQIDKEVNDQKWYKKLFSSLPKWGTIFSVVKGMISIAVSLLAIFGLFQTVKISVKQNKLIDQVLESPHSPYNVVPTLSIEEAGQYKLGGIAGKANPKVPIQTIKAQACEQQELVISKLIIANTFYLTCEYETEDGREAVRSFKCLGLIRDNYLILDHYINFIKLVKNPRLYFVKQSMMLPIPLSMIENLLSFRNSTFLVGKCHKTIPHFKNIIKFFISQSSTSNLAPQAKLYEMTIDNDRNFYLEKNFFQRIDMCYNIDVNNDDGSTTHVSTTYSYPKSGRGLCGSVLVTSANTAQPIIGIHVAGLSNGTEGFAEAVTYETFAFLLTEKGVRIEENALDEYIIDKPAKVSLDGNIIQLGTVAKKYAQHSPANSRLINTVNAGVITPITYDIPVLSKQDPRIQEAPFSPLIEGCKHHTNPCLDFNPKFLERAAEDVENMILSKVKPQRLDVGILSIEQAVCGIPDNVLYEPMAMDTSEGFPWILDRPKNAHNKSWMFDRTLTPKGWVLNTINAKLEQCIVARNAARSQGIIQPTIFVDCLKDAKLPLEKVLTPGKTRIFSISPVDFTISIRQYTYDFVVAYMASRIYAEHAVGIDIYSLETHKMVNYMLEYGNNMSCGDYSKFGDQLYALAVHKVFRIIANWMIMHGADKSIRIVLECFAHETANAIHLVVDMLYQCIGGMPSGNPLTVIINSMVNSMYIRVVWQEIMLKFMPSLISMADFNENVRAITYGDDLWLSIKDAVKHLYNTKTMQDEFARFNIKYTNASKDGNIVPYASILDPSVTFLKCTFSRHPERGVWMATMEKRVVEETSNWCWNTHADVQASSVEACKAMMELAYGHGREYYTQLRKRVLAFWQVKGVKIDIPDWDAIDIRIYET